MAANIDPIFPKSPVYKTLSLTTVSACTTRAPTVTASLAGANIFELLSTGTEMRRIDYIKVNAASTAIASATTPMLIQIWVWDGTTASLYEEIDVTALTPSSTSKSFNKKISFSDFMLPATYKIYISSTVATTASTNAVTVTVGGGEY